MTTIKEINVGKIDPSIKEVLKKLVHVNLDFCVVGGLLCQYYLKEHARYTKDIDILYNAEEKVVEEELKKGFGTIAFFYSNGTDSFYEPYFICFTKVDGLRGQAEGKKINFLSEIKTELYSYEGITFKGVCIEYMIAEKLVSLLNELSRPYKHLVDIYSFTKIDQSLLDKKEIKRYVSLINSQENEFRKSINVKEQVLPKQILDDKQLNPPIMVPTLQSKYNVSKEEMISEVNGWLKTVL
ncbi:MAG: nucleotidyl transferase AbiEii/AbiGii toxin family protein [Bacilli bacterium]|nr:nucleotidyl transferase AbiEii/AbiGii toxin family protein [Bacilli bacterium]